MASAWGKVKQTDDSPAVSLQDVMSEQMALDLQHQETEVVSNRTQNEHKIHDLLSTTLDQQSNPDFILAKLLQLEFDREFEEHSK
jgi:hypothetical protein